VCWADSGIGQPFEAAVVGGQSLTFSHSWDHVAFLLNQRWIGGSPGASFDFIGEPAAIAPFSAALGC
jgi:hypothetical protein